MAELPIYLDNMATTAMDPRVIAKMLDYMGPDAEFGNPASKTHVYGWNAAKAVEASRAAIADCIGTEAESLIFTSGATESNNLALFGAARFYQRKGRHIITLSTEHKAVLDCCKQLEREGFELSYLRPDANGLLDLEQLQAAIRRDTILVSVMQVNNEIGVIQDIAAIAERLKGRGILLHVDAAQSLGKLKINLAGLGVDLMSFSGHKIYGPKGIGALYIRRRPRVRLQPLIYGGGHELGLRAGTLPTPQIVALAEAVNIAESERETEQARLLAMREAIWAGISDLPGIRLNGDLQQRVAGNLNFSIAGVAGERLFEALHRLALSSASACSSNTAESSHVLKAIGLSEELAQSSVRLSLGRFNPCGQETIIIEQIRKAVLSLLMTKS